jgi:hypothetical protein
VTYSQTRSAGALGPNEVARMTLVASGLSPNTLYHARFEVDDACYLTHVDVHEAQVRHADDTVAGVCSPDKFHVEGPIYDEHAFDFREANNLLWRHNAAPLLSHTCDGFASHAAVPTTSSTSYVNLIATGVAARLQTQYHGTRRRPSAIPVEMAVLAIHSAGVLPTADFRLTDGTNNIDIAGAVISGSLGWFMTTGTISDTPADWEMQHRVSAATGTVRTVAWFVWPYEA